jgi:putative nucleotidyltransferase with HDIG domain
VNPAPEAVLSVDEARQLYERSGSGHDFDHVLRVLMLARRIALVEGADLAVVCTATLLHDVGESEGRRDHHLRGAAIAREILQDEPPEFIDAVAHAIEAHRFRSDPTPRTLEAQVVSDADKLDALGAIGVARVFAHAGSRGTALWRAPWQTIDEYATDSGGPAEPALESGGAPFGQPAEKLDAATGPGLLGAGYTPVHEYVYKLRRIPKRLYTAEARSIAAGRLAFMQHFFDELDREMTGADGGELR